MKPIIAAVVGPTASGKTTAAIALCQALGGEVVSMDSMQVYQGMDIGTAKPDVVERAGVPHHLMDVVAPGTPFSVTEYRDLADAAIADILARGRLPVLCGGTGFYLNALTQEMDFAEASADVTFRAELEQIAAAEAGKQKLHARLAEIDPQAAERLHANDTRRVIRALEIYHTTGQPMSAHAINLSGTARRYTPVIVGVNYPREQLYARINQRVEQMVRQGLLDEAKALRKQGIAEESQAMQAIGYKELWPVLRGDQPLAEAVFAIQQNTRRYAKRQLTWFTHDHRVTWFNHADFADAAALHAAVNGFVRRRITELSQAPEISEDWT